MPNDVRHVCPTCYPHVRDPSLLIRPCRKRMEVVIQKSSTPGTNIKLRTVREQRISELRAIVIILNTRMNNESKTTSKDTGKTKTGQTL